MLELPGENVRVARACYRMDTLVPAWACRLEAGRPVGPNRTHPLLLWVQKADRASGQSLQLQVSGRVAFWR